MIKQVKASLVAYKYALLSGSRKENKAEDDLNLLVRVVKLPRRLNANQGRL